MKLKRLENTMEARATAADTPSSYPTIMFIVLEYSIHVPLTAHSQGLGLKECSWRRSEACTNLQDLPQDHSSTVSTAPADDYVIPGTQRGDACPRVQHPRTAPVQEARQELDSKSPSRRGVFACTTTVIRACWTKTHQSTGNSAPISGTQMVYLLDRGHGSRSPAGLMNSQVQKQAHCGQP